MLTCGVDYAILSMVGMGQGLYMKLILTIMGKKFIPEIKQMESNQMKTLFVPRDHLFRPCFKESACNCLILKRKQVHGAFSLSKCV